MNVPYYILDADGFLLRQGVCPSKYVNIQANNNESVFKGIPNNKLTKPLSNDQIEKIRKIKIKQKANKAILLIAPEWKQRNLIATGLQLTEVVASGGTLTTDQQSSMVSIKAIWAQIAAIRAASDTAEKNGTLSVDFNP